MKFQIGNQESCLRMPLLKEVRELASHICMQISGGRLFQTETMVSAKALKWF